MNKQVKKKNGVVMGRGIEWTDFTHNPIGGCFHACQWIMPNGDLANCYAEDTAEGVAQAAYPQGFEHHYWRPETLNDPLNQKTPSKIFVGSMADVFGHWVEKEQIQQVLDSCRKAHWHTFQFLTKNPIRVKEFDIPPNCWIGASTPPDYIWNKPLTRRKQIAMLETTLSELGKLWFRGVTTWISAEPLSWDITPVLDHNLIFIDGAGKTIVPFDWIVIGAASNGKQYYAPEESHVRHLVDFCKQQNGHYNDRTIPVFFKGNLKALPWARGNWLEEFPSV